MTDHRGLREFLRGYADLVKRDGYLNADALAQLLPPFFRDSEARYREVIERARRTNVPAETMARRMAAEDDAGRTEHEPGDHHRYRIECEVCGQRGTIRLSIDPDFADPESRDSRPEEPPE